MKNIQALLLVSYLAAASAAKSQDTSITQISTSAHEAKSTDIPVNTTSTEAASAFREGLNLYDVGDNVKARAVFQKAIELDPNLAAAYIYQAIAQPTAEGFYKAVQQAEAHLSSASEWEKLFYAYAETFLTVNLDKRLSSAQQMVSQFPNLPRSYILLGNAYSDRNEPREARAAYGKAANLAPDWVSSYLDLTFSYMNQDPKDLKQAEMNAQMAVKLAPNAAFPQIALGDVYRAQSQWTKAKTHYTKAIDLDPTLAVAYIKRGHVNNFAGKYEEARKDYAESEKYVSDFPAGGTEFIALTYAYEGNPEKALQILQEEASKLQNATAKGKVSRQYGFLQTAAVIAFHQKDAQALTSVIDQLEPVSKEMATMAGTDEQQRNHQASMLYWRGLIQVLNGNYDAARTNAEEMKKILEPINNPRKLEDYHSLLGQIAYHQNDYQQAVEHFDQTNNMDIYDKYWRAKAYEKAGQKDKARVLYREVASYNFNVVGNALVRSEVQKTMGKQ